ncbi:hypothetical protein DF185_17765 [Marinifilum breve]|uniref:Uncharacterized protein n=1 Tax=Marinifilum breve TaxID=2184082 RepID=A0A2V3ZTR5_9BACT|nr:hypothetical protein DF185_17765 [Marinifilum breve]
MIPAHFRNDFFPFRENPDKEKGVFKRNTIKNTPFWLSPSPLEGENLELNDCIFNSLSNYFQENK